MFREMRRIRQQLPMEECLQILESEPRGVLSMAGDDGYPYGIPLSHWFCREDGHIYFHGARTGHKIDAIKGCDKVSFCVMDQGYRREGEWALNIRSVVVFGRMHPVEDEAKTRKICENLGHKFTDDQAYLDHELSTAMSRVQCFELIPEHITGKLVNES